MKAVLFVLLGCMMVTVYSIVCTPDYCDSVECDPTVTADSCSSSQEYRPNGGFCGCCPTCVTLLDKGSSCLQLRGAPPTAECRPPLVCNNGVCGCK